MIEAGARSNDGEMDGIKWERRSGNDDGKPRPDSSTFNTSLLATASATPRALKPFAGSSNTVPPDIAPLVGRIVLMRGTRVMEEQHAEESQFSCGEEALSWRESPCRGSSKVTPSRYSVPVSRHSHSATQPRRRILQCNTPRKCRSGLGSSKPLRLVSPCHPIPQKLESSCGDARPGSPCTLSRSLQLV